MRYGFCTQQRTVLVSLVSDLPLSKNVPVLSKSTMSTRRIFSSANRSRIRMPFEAPIKVVMATTSGIANPGHAGRQLPARFPPVRIRQHLNRLLLSRPTLSAQLFLMLCRTTSRRRGQSESGCGSSTAAPALPGA